MVGYVREIRKSTTRTGRNDPCPCGTGKKYKHCCMLLAEGTPGASDRGRSIPQTMQTALEHHRAGRLAEAQAAYRRVLEIAPDHPDALHCLGVLAHQGGSKETAAELIGKAIAVKPSDPVYHNHLGIVLQAQGRLSEAVACYRKALSLRREFPEAHSNLGNVLREQGRLDDAIASYRAALSAMPHYATAHYNLGNALKDRGALHEAIDSYARALSSDPDLAEAHNNLGTAFRDLGRLGEAVASYRRALSLKPDLAQTWNNLGNVLQQLGDIDAALVACKRALELEETAEFKAAFARCVASSRFASADAVVRGLVTRALSEAWVRPGDLTRAGASLVRLDRTVSECIERALTAWPKRVNMQELLPPPALIALSGDSLLQSLLQSTPVCDLELERFLTMVRYAMLQAATATEGHDHREHLASSFCCALARQCFINDYVFCCADDEWARAQRLRDRLEAALWFGETVPASWLVVVAAYFPLSSVACSEALPARPWPGCVAALLAQQVVEPREEAGYRAGMPQLTAVEDGISRLVQRQYEEHPYPRWIKAAPIAPALSLDAYVRQQFPFAPFEPGATGSASDILIAGCGTGQESIEMAQRFPRAQVLAVDLSLSSLCYAKRKTRELGLGNVQYAQGDILDLGSAGRTFDLVASVGVLHHLADPAAGLQRLLSLLRPGGLMRLGLYSERARQVVVFARHFIAEHGYTSSAADIRRCRQDLMSAQNATRFKQLTLYNDFFVTGECRDLLFHVQEHRFTLPQIKAMLAGFGLQFIGFALRPHVIRTYRERFPADRTLASLDCWNDFECEFPDTFAGMYLFWVRKPGGPWTSGDAA